MTSPARNPKSAAGPPRVSATIRGRPETLSNIRRTPIRPRPWCSFATRGRKGAGLVVASGGGVACASARAGRKPVRQAVRSSFMGCFLFWTLGIVIQVLYLTFVKMNRKTCNRGALAAFLVPKLHLGTHLRRQFH